MINSIIELLRAGGLLPLGLAVLGLLVGGVAALIAGPVGSGLGYILRGRKGRLAGALLASLPVALIVGATAGYVLGGIGRIDSEWLMLGLWVGVGLLLAPSLAAFRARRSPSAPTTWGPVAERAADLVARRFSIDLQTFICLIVGAGVGLSSGGAAGLMIAHFGAYAPELALSAGCMLGLVLGLISGGAASRHGGALRFAIESLLATSLAGFLGMMVIWIGQGTSLTVSAAVTGGLVAVLGAILVAGRLHSQARESRGRMRRSLPLVVAEPSGRATVRITTATDPVIEEGVAPARRKPRPVAAVADRPESSRRRKLQPQPQKVAPERPSRWDLRANDPDRLAASSAA